MGGLIVMALGITAVQVAYTGQELCDVFPKNPVVLYGSNLTVFFKAPLDGNCHRLTHFNPSRLYWTLNYKRIDQKFYCFNSTISTVSILNLSIEEAIVECLLDGYVLGGTIIQTYLPHISLQNITCIGKQNVSMGHVVVNCTWDPGQNFAGAKYKVCLKQDKLECESKEKRLTANVLPNRPLSIIVSVQYKAGEEAHSYEFSYESVYPIIQMAPPVNVHPKTELNVLGVTWECNPSCSGVECEVRLHEKDSHTKSVVKSVENASTCTFNLTNLKTCTNYSVSVRCRYVQAVWSKWSQEATALTNVSLVHFHLWRTKSVLDDEGNRTVHLMWKGMAPSCEPFDKYCLSDLAQNSNLATSECSEPFQNHTFITTDQYAHTIKVAAFHNRVKKHIEASIEIPSVAEDVDLPPISNVSVLIQHGQIHVTWQKPRLPVSGYIIVWNSTSTNHMWHHTRESNFTLKGEPLTLYTIALTPLYENGPGDEIRFQKCTKEGTLPTLSIFITGVSDRKADVHWSLASHTQCSPPIVNYTVCYKASSETEQINITVGPNQHSVVLEDLQPNTAYNVHMRFGSIAAASTSEPFSFSTKPSKIVLTLLIAGGVGICLLPGLVVCTLILRRKYLHLNIPNPQSSSLSIWAAGNCKQPWPPQQLPWGSNIETILPCQEDSEFIGGSTTSKINAAPHKAWTDGQKIATQKNLQPLAKMMESPLLEDILSID